jgi:hypothetical protein
MLQEPHGIPSQKTAFFNNTSAEDENGKKSTIFWTDILEEYIASIFKAEE